MNSESDKGRRTSSGSIIPFSPSRAQIELVITGIQSQMATASRMEREEVAHLDIKAQRMRCDAALSYFANHGAIVAECIRRTCSLRRCLGSANGRFSGYGNCTKCSISTSSKRLKYDGDDFGFRLACRLVGIPVDSNDETDRHDETDDSGDEPNYDDAHERHETPDWLFYLLDDLLHFTVDVCASATNSKLEKHYTREMNGLLQKWLDERVWCNPPYAQGEIRKWLGKIIGSDAELVMALLPARMNAKWWRELVQPFATIVLIPPGGRLTFGDFEQTSRDDVVLVLFSRKAPWALDALAPYIAETIAPVQYDEGGKRLGTLQTAMLLREPRVVESLSNNDDAPPLQFWLAPPEQIAEIEGYLRERGLRIAAFDPCPHPLPEGFDSLSMKDWPCEPDEVILVNAPFNRQDEVHGRGLGAWVLKAKSEAAKGKRIALFLPMLSAPHDAVAAGATVRALGRVAWLETQTRQPRSHPTCIGLFMFDGTRSEQ